MLKGKEGERGGFYVIEPKLAAWIRGYNSDCKLVNIRRSRFRGTVKRHPTCVDRVADNVATLV